jgi:hypothetical protein
MKALILTAVLTLLPLAIAQEKPAEELRHLLASGPKRGAQLAALSIQRGADYPSVIELRGKAEVRTRYLVLTADEIDFQEGTGEMDARGHVHVKTGDF